MVLFYEVLKDCSLIDVGFSSPWFTREIGNLPETNIRERLDNGVVNIECIDNFPKAAIRHFATSFSEHYALT